MTHPPVTVGRLIHLYRAQPRDHTGREDDRHARWWIEELGALPVSELTTERIRQTVDRSKTEGRSWSTVRMASGKSGAIATGAFRARDRHRMAETSGSVRTKSE